MKHYLPVVLALLLFAACNTKNDTAAVPVRSNYFTEKVGTDNKGIYKVTNLDTIQKAWEADVANTLKLEKIDLKDFEIVKIKSDAEGAEIQECYILRCTSTDGSAKVAALLELKEGVFYFEKKKIVESYNLVICKGECSEGCLPGVTVQNGSKYLYCSSCVDCQKLESEMH